MFSIFLIDLFYPLLLLYKVKVMMRICPSLEAADSSEFQSFLKVDSRKKQLTLYDSASSPHSSSGHRRSATVAVPKIFAFDAVFTQDASQVRTMFFLKMLVRNSEGQRDIFMLTGCDQGIRVKGLSRVRGAFLPMWV